MSKSGQAFVAATEGHQFTLYAVCRALGIPLTEEQEKFQAYLERTYPAVVTKEAQIEYPLAVKKILKKILEDFATNHMPSQISSESYLSMIDEANRRTLKICQLFPKSPDNPDGYEEEAKAIDCQAECRHYQRCYPFVNPVMCTKSEPKPAKQKLKPPA